MDAKTISWHIPLGTTSNVCQKSPPNTITFPPNGKSDGNPPGPSNASRILLSRALKEYLLTIGASSHMINFVLSNNAVKSLRVEHLYT